jgi:hypothetical protein
MDNTDFSTISDPKRLSSQIEFVEMMIENDEKKLEELADDRDIEVMDYVLRITGEILKSLKELQSARSKAAN